MRWNSSTEKYLRATWTDINNSTHPFFKPPGCHNEIILRAGIAVKTTIAARIGPGLSLAPPVFRAFKKKGKPIISACPSAFCYFASDYFLPLPNNSAPHFLAVASSTSRLDSATGGKSFIHS